MTNANSAKEHLGNPNKPNRFKFLGQLAYTKIFSLASPQPSNTSKQKGKE